MKMHPIDSKSVSSPGFSYEREAKDLGSQKRKEERKKKERKNERERREVGRKEVREIKKGLKKGKIA